MFENLSDKLQRAFKNLRGQGTLNEENVGEALREIRLALLEADVNFKVVKELVERIRAKALGQEVMTALSPAEQVMKIVRDEMVEVLGRDTAKLRFASTPPSVVLMAGLQGSGKTTTSGKLAHWLKNGGHRPLLVSVDVYRPAAREQLKIVAQAVKAHLYEGQVTEANTATVERLAEIIIPSDATPGAKEAGVAEFIDFLVASDPEVQYDFRTGLTWLNAHAERNAGKRFVELTGGQQISLLEPLGFKDKARPGEEAGRRFFSMMREYTVTGFYTSEIGFKELDSPALKFYSESPECPHKDDPEHRHLSPMSS
jgi:hypothetical protein